MALTDLKSSAEDKPPIRRSNRSRRWGFAACIEETLRFSTVSGHRGSSASKIYIEDKPRDSKGLVGQLFTNARSTSWAPGVMQGRASVLPKLGNYPAGVPEYVTSSGVGRPKVEMTEATELTDDGLLRRAMAGDEDAFSLLYKRRHRSIYRFALYMSGNAAVAEDVTQEVFMTLIRDPKRFDAARGTLPQFLLGVARNHLRKRWEKDRRLVSLVGDADELESLGSKNETRANGSRNGNSHGHYVVPTSRDEFTTIENVSRVRRAIKTLPENYREVVVLCELEEMSYQEAAAALGCPVGTVRSRLHRARSILLEKLRDTHPLRHASAVGER